jgi:hypothetical protein
MVLIEMEKFQWRRASPLRDSASCEMFHKHNNDAWLTGQLGACRVALVMQERSFNQVTAPEVCCCYNLRNLEREHATALKSLGRISQRNWYQAESEYVRLQASTCTRRATPATTAALAI